MITWFKKHRRMLWYLAGLCVVSVSLLPYFILKENIWVPFHDQLDGEVPNYIYQAKYLFRGSVIPELMNGIPKTGMLPPAPFGVLFFCLFSPFPAYVALQLLVTVTGYTGMFLSASELTKDDRIGFLCGGLFAYLPFMPVYGLSIAGLPLLGYAAFLLYEGKTKRNKLLSCGYFFLYAGFSSFALVGFAVCVVWLLGVLAFAVWQRKHGPGQITHGRRLSAGLGILFVTYAACNFSLFSWILTGGKEGMVSHRTEFVLTPVTDYWGTFTQIFFGRDTYTPAFSEGIFALTVVLVLIFVFRKDKKQLFLPLAFLGLILLFTLAALVWNSPLSIHTIRKLGPLAYFQADRISWLIPPLWYGILALDFKMLLALGKRRAAKIAGYGCALGICVILAAGIYEQSFFYHQLRQVVFPDSYKIMTWKQYYAEDIFTQIDESIGRDKEEYRVASLGMSPAAALYNGFYCLDGYSNNYPLEYKHAFRKVMEKELEKSEASRIYFDTWGNRCNLISAESGATPMIGKNTATAYEDLQIDVEQLKRMGCAYLFSAMEIRHAEELGLSEEGVYETPSSYYRVYVYQLL